MKAKDIFSSLLSLVDITIPEDGKITVCGDVHGKFFSSCFSVKFDPVL
jgi:serine/threonine-protein phosphatase 5